MKCIIAGSRSIDDYNVVCRIIDKLVKENKLKITEVVSGGAKGVDLCGEEWAKTHNIKIKRFTPDWKNLKAPGAVIKENEYGKYNNNAGKNRNQDMGKYTDIAIILHDGESRGTQHMHDYMIELKKPVYQYVMGCEQEDDNEVDGTDDIPF